MSEILELISNQFQQQSLLELAAVLLALAYVWLAAKQIIWCWPCAFVSTSIFTYLFWEVSLPFHTLLNVYYIGMAVYGWWQWNKPQQRDIQVITWPYSRHISAIASLVVVSVILAQLANSIFDANYLYLDAFITVFSVFTTVLVAHKVRENWLYWIVINSISVYLYLAKDLYLTALLTVLYFGFAVYGYVNWGKTQQTPTKLAEN
ncbi:nicotinamide riboside transporter PnuC [Paraglaciecola aquimarina]|uniref:Nicotinamide riboside transporter PnuC n=1 Tax=Paraglaciecola aquimarina TaxID=1235557 RepID=A0ABU3SZZ1_9ALTE|nr:nicotinamide riboside transporter PnuC [Paraglaciecola aquimarina]MDU0355586.1 nicotinamide riboside transporter PnuC [Paraglaciecola aquimarina]